MKTTRRMTGQIKNLGDGCEYKERDKVINNSQISIIVQLTNPFDPRRGQAAQHGKHIKREEAGDGREQMRWHNCEEIPVVQLLDIGVKDWEHRQRHEKYEKHVEKLHGGLLEDGPVGWACVDIDA